jgi:hypothetical protein
VVFYFTEVEPRTTLGRTLEGACSWIGSDGGSDRRGREKDGGISRLIYAFLSKKNNGDAGNDTGSMTKVVFP